MKNTLKHLVAGLLLAAGIMTSSADEDGMINFATFNPASTNLGRVFSSTGVGAPGPAYVGQLYGSTVSNLNSLAPLGVPVAFDTNPTYAGYISSAIVRAPGVAPGTPFYYALRAWNASSGGFVNATTNGIFGTSEIKRIILGGTNDEGFFAITLPAKTHSNFALLKATSLALVSSLNPSTNGNNVAFTATASSSSGTPTGNVIFRTNGVAMSTNTLSGGVANASTAALPTGTNTVTAVYVSANDFAGNAKSLDGGFGGQAVLPGAFTISGSVQLQSFASGSRMVQFVTSEVIGGTTNYLLTTNVTLTFSGGIAAYSIQVPANSTNISAKTAWNLRKRLPANFNGGSAATVNFTNTAAFLKAGDVVTVDGSTNILDSDNLVNLSDYNKTVTHFLQSGNGSTQAGRADVTGDGIVNLSDYNKVVENFLQSGDPK